MTNSIVDEFDHGPSVREPVSSAQAKSYQRLRDRPARRGWSVGKPRWKRELIAHEAHKAACQKRKAAE